MTQDSSNRNQELLDALKRAVVLLEQPAQDQAEQNAKASEDRAAAAQLVESLLIVRHFLLDAVKNQPELREALSHLSQWLSDITKAQEPAAPIAPDSAAVPVAIVVPAPTAPPQQVPLMLGGAATLINVPGTSDEAKAARLAAERTRNEGWSVNTSSPIPAPMAPVDMATVNTRCLIKAEGCDWAAHYREQWEDDYADHTRRKASYDDIIARARALPNCYVWPLNPRLSVPASHRMAQYAQAYRNLAHAAELAHSIHRDGPHGGEWLLEAYTLLAQAQSALRAALEVDALYSDSDQEEAFRWLRTRTSEDRVLVPRHMKLEDPADFADSDDLTHRLNTLRTRLSDLRQQGSQKRAMLGKARYHARFLQANPGPESLADWRKFVEAINALVDMGVPPSDVEIRDLMVPIIDQAPDGYEFPPNVERVMESVDEYLGARESDDSAEPRQRAVSPEVAEVAALLEGQVIVLIGGQVRPQSKRALERDLHLAELRWVPAAHHQSHYMFESAIARPETALVMLAIRWASHSFENVDELCRRYGKPYVRLPGGYSPNQVAKQIIEQVGQQVRNARVRTLGV